MPKYSIPILTLFVGLIIGYLIFSPSMESSHDHETADQIWTCSMHPNIRQNEPGDCPICGMDLIPATSAMSSSDTDPYSMQMTDAAVRLADIRTMTVQNSSSGSMIQLPGRVVARESATQWVTSFIDGRVTSEAVGYEGKQVTKGDELLRIVSPDVATAWIELRTEGLAYDAVATKLRYWGLTDAQIAELRNSPNAVQEISLLAPVSGVVMKRDVRPGSLVAPGMVLYEIVDLSAVWVEFDAFEGDVAGVGVGSSVSFTLDALVGESFTGRVTFINPTVDAMSRRVRIRVQVPNPSGKLKPDMLARGEIAGRRSSGITIPSSAVLWTGPRSVVYVKVPAEHPTFELREVNLGPKSGDNYVILEGLQAGDEVVVNGAFTVDAEFQLAGKASMMNRPERASNTFLKPVMDAYFPLKDALIDSDADAGVTAAKHLLKVLEAQPKRNEDWNVLIESLKEMLQHWEHAPGLEQQRANLFKLSDALRAGLSSFGGGQVTYVQFCPMAFDNTGARWLSNSATIENPYLPETMLGCGDVVTRL